jgi:hypothetical protein
MSKSIRKKEDLFNSFAGGFVAGAVSSLGISLCI